jgi:hypothetical protein
MSPFFISLHQNFPCPFPDIVSFDCHIYDCTDTLLNILPFSRVLGSAMEDAITVGGAFKDELNIKAFFLLLISSYEPLTVTPTKQSKSLGDLLDMVSFIFWHTLMFCDFFHIYLERIQKSFFPFSPLSLCQTTKQYFIFLRLLDKVFVFSF